MHFCKKCYTILANRVLNECVLEGETICQKVCAITGKGPLSGNKRSHSMRAFSQWNVNLQKVKVIVDGNLKRSYQCSCVENIKK